MIRISIPWLIDAVESIDGLRALKAGEQKSKFISQFFDAMIPIENIYDNSLYKDYMKVSRISGQKLYENILTHFKEIDKDDSIFTDQEIAKINSLKQDFMNVFRG